MSMLRLVNEPLSSIHHALALVTNVLTAPLRNGRQAVLKRLLTISFYHRSARGACLRVPIVKTGILRAYALPRRRVSAFRRFGLRRQLGTPSACRGARRSRGH